MHKPTRIGFLVCVACICLLSGICAAQTKLIIARHGTSDYDPAKPQLVNGVPDPPLSPQGKEEALRLARLAQAEGMEVIVHSPLRRARETAEIVARELKRRPVVPVVNAALTEFNLGDLLGKDWSQSPYREQLAEVMRHPANKRPGGESFNELSARVTKALRRLRAQHRNRNILLIAHGITNRALLGSLRGLSTAEAFALPSQANHEAFLVHLRGNAVEWKAVTLVETDADKWRADLRFMAEEMPRTHKNLFHTITREQFDAAVKQLHERIPQLARHQIIVELMRIVAMVGDGHTNIAPTRDAKIGFRTLPVKMYLFKGGVFVRAATREHAEMVGRSCGDDRECFGGRGCGACHYHHRTRQRNRRALFRALSARYA
jgi:broad specificity phosphatase PhoE